MNTAEKLLFPIDGILEMLSSRSRCLKSPFGHPALPPLRQQQHPHALNLSKTGMGIIKSIRGCWRAQDRKMVRSSSSSGSRLVRRSVDLSEPGLINPKKCLRIVVLGAPGVGKTNIVRQFLGEKFEERYEPTVEDFYRKLFFIGGKAYQVDVLDAPSERNFPAKRRLSILTGDIFLLVFSLDDRESLNEIHEALVEIKAAKEKLHKSNPAHPRTVPTIVCANKADLGIIRAVTETDVTEFLGKNVPVYETSAKDATGLEKLFKTLAILGGLPSETSPSWHQLVPILTYQSLCTGQRGRGRRLRGWHTHGVAAPCGAVDPLARRPSFTSDLQLVLGSSAQEKNPEKCPIQ